MLRTCVGCISSMIRVIMVEWSPFWNDGLLYDSCAMLEESCGVDLRSFKGMWYIFDESWGLPFLYE